MTAAVTDEERRRLRWHCRRGLLENDLVLERFLARYGHALDRNQLEQLNRLLALDDTELWDLVSGRAACSDPRLDEMLEMLREA